MLRGVSFAVVLALAASSCSSGTNDGSAAPETPPTAVPAAQETDLDQSGDLALAIEKLASSLDLLTAILEASEDRQGQEIEASVEVQPTIPFEELSEGGKWAACAAGIDFRCIRMPSVESQVAEAVRELTYVTFAAALIEECRSPINRTAAANCVESFMDDPLFLREFVAALEAVEAKMDR